MDILYFYFHDFCIHVMKYLSTCSTHPKLIYYSVIVFHTVIQNDT